MNTQLIVLIAVVTALVFCGAGIGIGYGIFNKSDDSPQNPVVSSSVPTVSPSNTTIPSSKPTVPTTTKPIKYATWQEQIEHANSCKQKWEEFPLLLISMDGFRAKYLELNRTKAIAHLMRTGTHAPYMYPSYPSVTFPNHYAIVTGLYPESHGIIDNDMYDPTIPYPDEFFSISKNSSHNPKWWGGEPMWNTVSKKGKISATYFWPGSDVQIEGMNGTHWFPYNGDVPFTTRVEGVVNWLQLPESERPVWMSLYFQEPDETGHQNGPDSGTIVNALTLVDTMIDYLMQKLFDADLIGCVNIIALADHGMISVKPASDYVFLDEFVKFNRTILPDTFVGPVGRISAANSSVGQDTLQAIVQRMNCNKSNEHYRIYDKAHMPIRLHYTNNRRIGDLVVDMDPAYIFSTKSEYYYLKGEHGYDYKTDEMHALFLAYGPAFKRNVTIPPFQNVELYNLMADVLNLSDPLPPNNGTKGALSSVVLNNYTMPVRPVAPVLSLINDTYISCGSTCTATPNSCVTNDICKKSVIVPKATAMDYQYLSTCSYSAVINSVDSYPAVVGSWVKNNSIVDSLTDCYIIYNPLTCDQLNQMKQQYNEKGISVYPLFQGFTNDKDNSAVDSRIFTQMAPMYDTFYKGVWSDLLQYESRLFVHYKEDMLTFTGPIYDADFNGLADSDLSDNQVPTHFYKILLRCPNGQWSNDYNCTVEPEVVSFVLPNTNYTLNYCSWDINATQFLYKNTARVRDIELATGLEFFLNFPQSVALKLRTHINQVVW